MIQSFANKETELIYHREFSRRLPQAIQKVALRKLMMIDNAKSLNDLRIPPNNRLEPRMEIEKGNTPSASTTNGVFALQ